MIEQWPTTGKKSARTKRPGTIRKEATLYHFTEKKSSNAANGSSVLKWRQVFLAFLGLIAFSVIVWRLASLQVLNNEYLQSEGQARVLRTIPLKAQRALITDRHGEPLAVSAQVASIWINPTEVDFKDPNWQKVTSLLNITLPQIKEKAQGKKAKHFLYIKRHIPPVLAKKVESLQLAGLHSQTEFQRFYPAGEVAAHVIGTTNIDDRGTQGLELALDEVLAGKNGRSRVLKDGTGRKIEEYEAKQLPLNGQDITLSLDSRIQYLAYRELMSAVKKHQAKSGSIVAISPKTGEVLAMVNYPSFNPNSRYSEVDERFRNRAVTDQFEPGSILKAFSMANILTNGKFSTDTQIDTNPGTIQIAGKTVRDVRNYGVLTLEQVLQKSSNVGIAQLTLSLPNESLYSLLRTLGFGQKTESGFPGETAGYVPAKPSRNPFEIATLSFGYGMTATPLQLAKAYAILANGGRHCGVSLVKRMETDCQQILTPAVAESVNKMLQLTVAQGTGHRAQVPGYAVAGKTGTVRKVGQRGYSSDNHVAFFAGFAPANDPEVALIVMIDEPKGGKYYGGEVAAPVFSKVMFGALRRLNVPQQF